MIRPIRPLKEFLTSYNSANFFAQPVPLTDTYANSSASNATGNIFPASPPSLVSFTSNRFFGVFTGSVLRIKPAAGVAILFRIQASRRSSH